MTYIPDSIERMESNIERLIDEVGSEGECSGCGKIVGFDNLHQISAHPDSPAGCWDCCVEHWGKDPAAGPLESERDIEE